MLRSVRLYFFCIADARAPWRQPRRKGSPPCAASGPVWAYRLLIPDLRGNGALQQGCQLGADLHGPAHLPTEKLPLSVGLPVGPAHNVVGLAPGIRQQLISSRCSSVVSGPAHSRGSTGCPSSGLPRRCNAHAARRRPYPSPPGRRQTAASRSFPRRYARCSTGRARPRRRGPRAFLAALVARVGHLDGGDDIAHTALCPGIRVAVVEPVIDWECVKHGRHLFCTNKNAPKRNASGYLGAGYESRTRHLLLGKQSLYRMS